MPLVASSVHIVSPTPQRLKEDPLRKHHVSMAVRFNRSSSPRFDWELDDFHAAADEQRQLAVQCQRRSKYVVAMLTNPLALEDREKVVDAILAEEQMQKAVKDDITRLRREVDTMEVHYEKLSTIPAASRAVMKPLVSDAQVAKSKQKSAKTGNDRTSKGPTQNSSRGEIESNKHRESKLYNDDDDEHFRYGNASRMGANGEGTHNPIAKHLQQKNALSPVKSHISLKTTQKERLLQAPMASTPEPRHSKSIAAFSESGIFGSDSREHPKAKTPQPLKQKKGDDQSVDITLERLLFSSPRKSPKPTKKCPGDERKGVEKLPSAVDSATPTFAQRRQQNKDECHAVEKGDEVEGVDVASISPAAKKPPTNTGNIIPEQLQAALMQKNARNIRAHGFHSDPPRKPLAPLQRYYDESVVLSPEKGEKYTRNASPQPAVLKALRFAAENVPMVGADDPLRQQANRVLEEQRAARLRRRNGEEPETCSSEAPTSAMSLKRRLTQAGDGCTFQVHPDFATSTAPLSPKHKSVTFASGVGNEKSKSSVTTGSRTHAGTPAKDNQSSSSIISSPQVAKKSAYSVLGGGKIRVDLRMIFNSQRFKDILREHDEELQFELEKSAEEGRKRKKGGGSIARTSTVGSSSDGTGGEDVKQQDRTLSSFFEALQDEEHRRDIAGLAGLSPTRDDYDYAWDGRLPVLSERRSTVAMGLSVGRAAIAGPIPSGGGGGDTTEESQLVHTAATLKYQAPTPALSSALSLAKVAEIFGRLQEKEMKRRDSELKNVDRPHSVFDDVPMVPEADVDLSQPASRESQLPSTELGQTSLMRFLEQHQS